MTLNNSNSGNILQLFEEKQLVKVCAPMVRYSKLQFRTLVRNYGCDLCFTPMILADSFCQSNKARNNEFTTSMEDAPTIVQFAAKTVHDFVGASYMVSPYCNGVDLNCGCPQRWAKQMGIGCIMLEQPELITDLVKQCRNRICKPFTVSVKLRILKDLRRTVEICKRLEKAGVDFLSVHARTSSQHTGSINENTLKLVVENVNCPVIGNGGIKTLEECVQLQNKTKCQGIMIANGLLTNPMLFSGVNIPSTECVQKWLNICYNSTLNTASYNKIHSEFNIHSGSIPEKPPNLTFQCFHHHLVFMLEKVLPRYKRRLFNNLQSFKHVLEFLSTEFGITPQLYDVNILSVSEPLNLDYCERDIIYYNLKPNNGRTSIVLKDYNTEANSGIFLIQKSILTMKMIII